MSTTGTRNASRHDLARGLFAIAALSVSILACGGPTEVCWSRLTDDDRARISGIVGKALSDALESSDFDGTAIPFVPKLGMPHPRSDDCGPSIGDPTPLGETPMFMHTVMVSAPQPERAYDDVLARMIEILRAPNIASPEGELTRAIFDYEAEWSEMPDEYPGTQFLFVKIFTADVRAIRKIPVVRQ